MESVALEWISSLKVGPRDVVQFVQQLNNVPEDALCEVGDILSRRWRPTGSKLGNQNEKCIRNEVHLSCEPKVAEFLSKKFGKQTRHITGGEVIRIRCKRVYPGIQPPGQDLAIPITSTEDGAESDEVTHDPKSQDSTPQVLPLDKVIALIDLLGDQVIDAQEAYELFAEPDVRTPQRMTILGLSKALARLRKKESTSTKVTVESLKNLLSKLIASNNVGVQRIPPATTVPFLSYTDFLACYVAYLARPHT